MTDQQMYLHRGTVENGLVALALQGCDMHTLVSLAASYGMEQSFLERVRKITPQIAKHAAPHLIAAQQQNAADLKTA